MKKIKILSVLLISVLILFTLSISAYAEEDYNTVIGVKFGGTNKYISTYGINGSPWSSYVDMYNKNNDDGYFSIAGGYVVYRDSLLVNKTGDFVKATDRITVAAGCIYETVLLSTLYHEEPAGLFFNSAINGWTFGQLANIYNDLDEYTFSYGGYYGNYYMYYNARQLYYGNEAIKLETIIDSQNSYTYTSSKCEHDYKTVQVVEEPTCVSSGSAFVECRACGYRCVEEWPADATKHSFQNYVSHVSSTCTMEGFYTAQCIYCDETITNSIPKVNHNFTEPTCVDAAVCTVCGTVGQSALGHKLVLGFCIRKNCSFSEAGSWLSGAGEKIEKELDDLGDNFQAKVDESKEEVNNFFDKLLLVVAGFMIVPVFVLAIYWIAKRQFNKKLNNKSNWRR